ncbi:MAG: hypothetical protein HZC55_11985 [Verrucomicrobia bacterium]|nr:hypothetical protein [Verrucomicrobiota bacterium]
MKPLPLLSLMACCLVGLVAGCGHMDLAPEGARNRVVTGTLNPGVALPVGAEILVRVIQSGAGIRDSGSGPDIPVNRQGGGATERILGEQVNVLATVAGGPVPFKVEFEVEDAVLRRGVNLEARVSYNGRVRFRTVQAHVVTLASIPYPQTLGLQPADR